MNSNRMAYHSTAGALVLLVGGTDQFLTWNGTAWLATTPSQPPAARREPGFSSDGNAIVMIGGQQGVAFVSDPQLLQPVGAGWGWFAETPTATSPDPRANAGTAYDANLGVAVMVGGGTTASSWVFGATQREPADADSEPSARSDAAVTFDVARGETVLFGGNTGANRPWIFKRAADEWTWTLQTPAMSPGARRGAKMAFETTRNRTILFGGNVGMTLFGDTWSWNGTTWASVATTGPAPRTRHAIAYDAARDRIVLFGGYTGVSISGTTLGGDTWEWDGTTWTQMTTTVAPSPRAGATLTYDPLRQRVVLFGGTDYPLSSGTFDDWWEWDGTTWTRIGNDPRVARSGRTAYYDPMRRGLVVFGGVKTALDLTALNNDTWLLHYASSEPTESCRVSEDGDHDGLIACLDPDCWGRCSPLCAPGATCPTAAPRCGDGVCSTLEDYLICPHATQPAPACDG